jgi:hypothetical protein
MDPVTGAMTTAGAIASSVGSAVVPAVIGAATQKAPPKNIAAMPLGNSGQGSMAPASQPSMSLSKQQLGGTPQGYALDRLRGQNGA